ncbi:Pickpocket protein 28 [Orchesella cincta]|uniref:Pickpocket protein 28 n=1 Tax=Orchesella cincta TaxID=48709 RepID=A0A1D2NJQ7_ORCCI|nr:Pickpocket protein 28 [Orchesella cincta]
MVDDEEKESFECCPHDRRLEGFLGQVVRESNLHGVKYLATRNLHITERIYWIIAVLVCFGYSVYLVSGVVQKYFENPVIISFQPKETSIAQIPFPAITICNVNLMDGPTFLTTFDYTEKLIQNGAKKNMTREELWEIPGLKEAILHLDHMTHMCLSAKSFRRLINESVFDGEGNPDLINIVDTDLRSLKDDLLEHIYQAIGKKSLGHDMKFYKKENATWSQVTCFDTYVKITPRCEDMILKCLWARQPLNCSEIFFQISTRHGRCCVFNMMPKYILRDLPENDSHVEREKMHLPQAAIDEWKEFDSSKMVLKENEYAEKNYPRHQKAGGKPYGLSILVNPELKKYSSCNTNDGWGLKMVAHSPISLPDIMSYGKPIAPNSEVFANIDPQLTLGNDDLYSVNIKKRGCYLDKDKEAELPNYKYYSSENCMEECIGQLTYQNCSCVRYFMPRNSTQKICDAKKRECAENVKNNAAGKSGACSHCWPSCTEIKYKLKLSQFPLRENTNPLMFYNTSTQQNKSAEHYSIMHIYLGADSLYAKERKSLFDLSSLIGNAGGLLSLTLGFSIISLVELIYFFTLRAWFQYQSYKKNGEDDEHQNSERKESEQEKVSRKLANSNFYDNNHKMYYSWAVRNRFVGRESDQIAVLPVVEQIEKQMPDFHILSKPKQIMYPCESKK